MGYRSEVLIIFYPSDGSVGVDFAALKLWVDENYPIQEAVRDCEATVEYNEDGNYISIHYEDVKWYADYPHVQKVKAALAKLEEDFPLINEAHPMEPRAHWEKMTIGEDYNDTEYSSSGYAECRLNLHRSISID